MSNNIKILDCTLRDGGYVNNWEFSPTVYNNIVEGLQESGIDIIELGIVGKDSSISFNTKYNDLSEVPPIKRINGLNTEFCVMVTVGESENIEFPVRTNSTIDTIRLAFFKSDIEKAVATAKRIKSAGYRLYLQAMATYMYNEEELVDLLKIVNKLQPDAFYIVDSFGTLYPEDITKMAIFVDQHLDKKIPFGLHAHNNLQLAFANDIAFIELMKKTERPIMLDATILGMGRGAGNSCLELLTRYMNEKFGKHYDTEKIMMLYLDNLQDDFNQYYWGYAPEYYFSSDLKANSAYVWYLKEIKGIKNPKDIYQIIKKIPACDRYTLKKDVLTQVLKVMGK